MSLTGTTWAAIGPDPITEGTSKANGLVTSIEINPNNASVIYQGTAGGGVWRATDAGTSWKSLITRVETQSLVFSRVIMATQRQGHRSPALRTTLHRPPARRPVKTFGLTRSGPLSGPQSCSNQARDVQSISPGGTGSVAPAPPQGRSAGGTVGTSAEVNA